MMPESPAIPYVGNAQLDAALAAANHCAALALSCYGIIDRTGDNPSDEALNELAGLFLKVGKAYPESIRKVALVEKDHARVRRPGESVRGWGEGSNLTAHHAAVSMAGTYHSLMHTLLAWSDLGENPTPLAAAKRLRDRWADVRGWNGRLSHPHDALFRLFNECKSEAIHAAARIEDMTGAVTVTGQSEGDGGKSKQADKRENRRLSPCHDKAYGQYLAVIRDNPELNGAEDYRVFNAAKENLEDGETLPSKATWTRYVREARACHDRRKNTPRAGRKTSRSIVRPDQI